MHYLRTKLTLSFLTLLTSGASQAASFDDYGISMLDIRGVSPNPVMEVNTSDGKLYDQVVNKNLVFKVEAKARCEKAHWVKYGQILIYPKNAGTISDNFANKIVISKANVNQKTWSNSWRAYTFNVQPNQYLKTNAMKACNDEMGKRLVQGATKANLLKTGFTATMNKTDNQFNFTCGGFSPHSGHPKSVENNHPVTIQCGKYVAPPVILKARPLPTLKLLGADISMTNTNFKGSCPAQLPVKAKIKSNNIAGSFNYRFLEDGKPVSGWNQKNIAQGTTETTLIHSITIKPPRAKTPQGANNHGFQGNIQNNQGNAQAIPQLEKVPTRKVSIEVKQANQQMSDSQEYSATCKIPEAVLKLKPVRATLAKPDLTSRQGITIGNQSTQWNGSLTLSKKESIGSDARSCKFRFKYDVVNIGKADSGNAGHKLRKGMSVIHSANNFAVSKSQSRNVSGHVMLQPGNYDITATLDDAQAVAEEKENNNLFKVSVKVDDDCGGSTPLPRPGRR